jgi:hypothetical protein
MKKLLLIIALFVSTSLSAVDYKFTGVTEGVCCGTVATDIFNSNMTSNATDGASYIGKSGELVAEFASTLSAEDITKLKALFPSWTPDGF